MCVVEAHLMLQRRCENTDGLAVQIVQDGRQRQCYDQSGLDPEAEIRHRGFPHDQRTQLSSEIQGNKSLSKKKEEQNIPTNVTAKLTEKLKSLIYWPRYRTAL